MLLSRPLRTRRALRTCSMASASSPQGPIASIIERKVREALQPEELVVQNESHLHAGHAGNPGGGPDAETHFRLTVVSQHFEGQRPIQRHRTIYGLLSQELQSGVHALALNTRTPTETVQKR